MHWLVSLPLISGRKDRTWEVLQERSMGLSNNYKFEIPELRVGTLDTLMALSDELVKTNALMDGVVHKIRRQVAELSGQEALAELRVDNQTPDGYLYRFRWDEAKFPPRRALKESVDKATEIVARIEDEMKAKVSDYNATKSALSAATRKTGGSLAVRDVSGLVNPRDVVDTENLVTLLVVVPRFGLKEWQANYEKLCEWIVPRSSRPVAEDNDYCLVTAVLFRRVLDDFKVAARTRGYVVREYVPPAALAAGGEASGQQQAEELKAELATRRTALEGYCRNAFGEAFSCWLHVCAIRLFVESILRYGLPAGNFRAAVVAPIDKQDAKLRTALASAFGDGKSKYWKQDESSGAGLGGEEMFPYVSFTINIGE